MGTEAYRARFRRALHAALLLVSAVAFYAAGVLSCIANPGPGGITFLNIIRAFFTTKLTLLAFPAFQILGGAAAFLLVDRQWKDGLLNDKMGREFRHSENMSPYGNAHFEEPDEYVRIAQIRPLEACRGKILGQLTEDGSECIDFNPFDGRLNSHMLAIGTSGGGKTFTFVKPYMYQARKARHSLIVTDPDGGLYEDTAGYFRDNGYVVRKLDLKSLRKSDGWDALGTLRGENMGTNVKIFAQTVISNISTENNIYSSGSNSLLCACILRILLGHEYGEGEKTFKNVYRLLQNPAGYDFLETQFSKDTLTDDELPCLEPYLAFKQASGNLASNIATHLANGLQLLQDELVCDVLSQDDIDLTLPGRVPCVYYCQFPDSHDTFRFIVSLFFSMLFISLIDYADLKTEARKLDIPVDFLLDEFPSIGVIPDYAKKISVLRKRAINCVMIVQDLTQLRQNYEETWNTIINNCGTIVTLGINEPMVTAEWISQRLGETSIEVKSRSENETAGRRKPELWKRTSVGVGRRALLSPAEICKIVRDGSLIIFAGHDAVYARKVPHTLFPDAERLYATKPRDVPDIRDTERRKLLREAEYAYLERYREEHRAVQSPDCADLSDALYAEPPASLISMILDTVRADMRQAAGFFRNRKMQENAAPQSGTPDAIAEKGAFKRFYEDYCAAHSNPVPAELPEASADSSEEAPDIGGAAVHIAETAKAGAVPEYGHRNLEKSVNPRRAARQRRTDASVHSGDYVCPPAEKKRTVPETRC